MEWEIVIGLEVHAQLLTNTKLFCSCKAEFGEEANSNICPVCSGAPGALPTLNKEAVNLAVKAGLSLNSNINKYSTFARKNYFYPDLPSGYQITQFSLPIIFGGHIDIETENGIKKIGITRIHIENDAGKSIHEPAFSLVDLNRAGVPLIEIVSEPDMRNADEAVAYLKSLRNILRYINVCDGDMEKGSFRCDANISIMPKGSTKFGTRCEVKNINSFKFVKKAIEFEVERQKKVLESGGIIVQETKLFNSATGETYSMRSKEEAHDYRYFPEPDLLPLTITDEFIENINKTIPLLPNQRQKLYTEKHGISLYDAKVLTEDIKIANFFEESTINCKDSKKAANWIINELLRVIKDKNVEIDNTLIKPKHICELVNIIESGVISSKQGKEIFEKAEQTGKLPSVLVEESGMKQVSDNTLVYSMIDEVIKGNPNELTRFKNGEEKLFSFFVGQLMKASKGKVNPKVANELLKEVLDKLKNEK